MLKNLIKSIQNKLSGLEYEIVVCDDASNDGTKEYFRKNRDKSIKYLRNNKNQGFFKNLLKGIKNASNLIIWAISDDDEIGEREFVVSGIELIEKNGVDLVFGRLLVRYKDFVDYKRADFKNIYTQKEFLDSWFEIINHLCFSSFLFKKETLLEVYPNTKNWLGNTIDYHIIYSVVKNSQKIAFVNKIAYIWTKSDSSSLSSKNRSDLLFMLANIFAFPLANFLPKRDYDVDFFNKYILDALNTLVSNYYISQNETIFKEVLNIAKDTKLKKLYIYGRGEVGIMLKSYLMANCDMFRGFIDDYVISDDVISFKDFLKNNLFEDSLIVVASYKCDVTNRILRKIISNDASIGVISLYDIATKLFIHKAKAQ